MLNSIENEYTLTGLLSLYLITLIVMDFNKVFIIEMPRVVEKYY